MPTSAAPDPAPILPPRRWPWLLVAAVVGVLAVLALGALHAREQEAERAELQATMFAAELRDSMREITLFGDAVPERRLAPALRPVIASTAAAAGARIARLDETLDGDPRVARLQVELLEIRRLAISTDGPAAFAAELTRAAERMARTADAIAAGERRRAEVTGRETIAGGALVVLLSMAIVVLVLQRAQRVLVAAGRQQARQLQELAEHDPLTGLRNRRRLADDLRRLQEQVCDVRPVQVLICDLDGFKALNDTLGHEAGDDLLVRFAGHLTDVAGDGGAVYRLGGDEFCVLSRPGTDIAARVGPALAGEDDDGDGDGAVRGSTGLALWPTDAPTAREAMRLADERMYAAKAERRRAARAS